MDEESVRSEGSSVVYRHISRIMSKNYYSKMKTLAEGLMDIGLMTANASQLKAVIDVGPTHRYYSTLLPLIITSLVLQVLVGVLVLVLFTDDEDGENLRCKRINNVVVGVIFIITVLNVLIGGFGISASPPDYYHDVNASGTS